MENATADGTINAGTVEGVTAKTPASDGPRGARWWPADEPSASHWVESPAASQWPAGSGQREDAG